MDWHAILSELNAERLVRLSASAGIQRASTAKKSLVRALLKHLDDALKIEALAFVRIDRLREMARQVRPQTGAARRHELIEVLIASESDDEELELSELDFLLPDRGRRDLPEGHNIETAIEMLPSRPTGRAEAADVTLALEVQQLLRRPSLRRAVIVVPSASSSLLGRLVVDNLDDLIESVVRHVESGRDERAPLTFILDGQHHDLGNTATGQALVAIAQSLRGVVEIRLAPTKNRLQAQLLSFEEERPRGAFLTAVIGGGALPTSTGVEPADIIEANVRIAGTLGASSPPCSLVKEWVTVLLRDARSLTDRQLREFEADEQVVRKVRYKRDFDTAHELALKHLAEHICRRGRYASPMFDPTALDPPPPHQHVGVCLAARPYQHGVLLLDAAGLGKTVEAGLILSRELRRRRVLASSAAVERRRAIVVAPTSLHGHWREELTAKLGLEVRIYEPVATAERAAHAQVLVCGPATLRRSWEELQGADVLVVDEPFLFGDETLSAIRELREGVELCIVASSAPAFDDPADLLGIADMACPQDHLADLSEMVTDDVAATHLGQELRGISARTRLSEVPHGKALASRNSQDRVYELDAVEVEAYGELRRMRSDYLSRGDHEHAGAFAALERTLLSSSQAFAAAACRVLENETPTSGAVGSDLFVLAPNDTTLSFLRSSGYFKRRLRRVRERLGGRTQPSAPLCAKEAQLLAVLAECKRSAVVILTQYRATAARLSVVLQRAKMKCEIEMIDEASTLRERIGIVTRFRERCRDRRVTDGPTGVLICTDHSAEELSLQNAARVIVSYDLPWNPQVLERRIARLARLGQPEAVRVFNLVAMHPDKPMWTMDARIAYACRELFGMANGQASPALFEVEPKVLTARLTEDDAPELSLIEEPDPEAIAEVDALLGAGASGVAPDVIEAAVAEDRRLRDQLTELWSRVSRGHGTLAGSRGHLFSRLQQALLQGTVGVLCAPDRRVEDCDDWHLVVGLRLLVESAAVEGGVEPWVDAADDVWLVEDEVVHLWAVSPGGELMDWAEFLLGEGLVEVPADAAERVVSREVLDYLLAEKAVLEARRLDAVPLAAWLASAPPSVKTKLDVVAEHAAAMAEVRHAEIEAAWAEAKDQRLVRLDARRAVVEDDAAARRATDAALARAHAEDVTIRHEVLATQLFVVMH